MSFSEYFPIYNKLPAQDQTALTKAASLHTAAKGTLLHNGAGDCMGLLLIRSGQLRAYITSDEGKELTIYRLFSRDICLLSAPCMMNSLQFDIQITAEKDTEFWLIPPNVYKEIMERDAALANFTNQLMATRFTDVMWLVEQIMWKSFDKRLAQFLLEESVIEESQVLKITHESIANHMGTAREVVTRMLRYFQSEEMVQLTRGTITLLDTKKLEML